MTPEIASNTGIAPTSDSAHSFAKGQLKAIIERIEKCEEEKKTISDDIKDIYAEAKGSGLEEKALQTAEREAQIRAYYEILEAKKQRKDDELWSIADIYMQRYGDEDILRSRLASIRTFLDRLDYYEVLEAMELATNKMYSKAPAFNYFCGICWRKIKRANGEDV